MKGSQIRQTFLDFFEERGHRIVPSSPLIPRNDPTLFFTNAGMVQFKGVFTGEETRPYSRATTAQKVMRVSGKHNDLENVGFTPRHHTFFEMLGNFSFGDYFKKDAIRYAWDLLINRLGIDPDPLWVTVFRDDDEAASLWIDEIGLPPWKVVRMDEKDNFWSMGDTGPCGPCSEIHVDRLHGVGPERVGPDQDPERFLEIWNLVFMQFERQADGTMLRLPKPSIDTGMGLERIAAVLQKKETNYDTDLFLPIIHRTAELAGRRYGDDPNMDTSLRVIADHSRAAAFLVADGVIPSKEARGYVLRRIMRRAIRHGVKLGLNGPFLHQSVDAVITSMGEAFPELVSRKDVIEAVVLREEERFSETLGNGLRLFRAHAEEARSRGLDNVSGETAFKLYDTFGFPVDLTQVIAREEGLDVDMAGFEAAMDTQRQRARQAWVGSGEMKIAPIYRELAESFGETPFVGYQTLEHPSVILALVAGGKTVASAEVGAEVEVLVEETPFYAEGGGQVGDTGQVFGLDEVDGVRLRVEITDTQKPAEGLVVHRGIVREGVVKTGDPVRLVVAREARAATRRNHTATHLLHAALRRILGTHVAQRGSLVGPRRLRFDFSHFQPVTTAELRQIEDEVNAAILANPALEIGVTSMDEAMKAGVTALFGEKYGERVRVVEVPGISAELCGGTHVDRTGDIGLFKIQSETGIASGVRRIEAQTGIGALEMIRQEQDLLRASCEMLRAHPAEVPDRITKLLEANKRLEAEISKLKASMLERPAGGNLEDQVQLVAGMKLLALETDADSPKVLRDQADRLRDKLQSGIVLLASRQGGKVTLLAAVTADLTSRVSAHSLVQQLAPMVGGRGGGKAELAQAGGVDVDGIPGALAAAPSIISGLLG